MNKEITPTVTDNEEAERTILLLAFQHALDNNNAESDEEALVLARRIFGESVTNETLAYRLMKAFMWGFEEGMRVNDAVTMTE